MQILLVENNPLLLREITLVFHAASLSLDVVQTGEGALLVAQSKVYHAILVGPNLPDMSGTIVVRRLRAAEVTSPILLLVSKLEKKQLSKAVVLGVSDLVVLPFEPFDLVSRVKVAAHGDTRLAQPTLTIGNLRVHLDSRAVTVDEIPVLLTPKEYDVLELLAVHKGATLSRNVFFNHLYADTVLPTQKILDVFVCKLRKKLARAGAGNVIRTVWGRGYMLRDPGVAMSPSAQP